VLQQFIAFNGHLHLILLEKEVIFRVRQHFALLENKYLFILAT